MDYDERDPRVWPADLLDIDVTALAKKNPNESDSRVEFDHHTHTYRVDGGPPLPISVSGLYKTLFPKDDSKQMCSKMSKYTRAKNYKGMTDDQILQQWETTRDNAALDGRRMHAAIEIFFNTGIVSKDPVLDREMKQFVEWYRTEFEAMQLVAHRTEQRLFSDKVAGSPDLIARSSKTGEWYIFDWKRSDKIGKSMSVDGKFGYAEEPWAGRLENTNFNHYSLQLHTYRSLLMKEHGYPHIPVENLIIVAIHPNLPAAEALPCANVSSVVDRMLENIDYLIAKHKKRLNKG
jgi:hypothetical protein